MFVPRMARPEKKETGSPVEIFKGCALIDRIGQREERVPRFVDVFLESVEDGIPEREDAVTAGIFAAARTAAHTVQVFPEISERTECLEWL